jgi:predicted DNA-binding transcriptional regulator YafY
MKSNDYLKTRRIRLICDFLNNGGGKLYEMEAWVNDRLEDEGLKPIGKRTLQTCIESLRKGDFEHSLSEEPIKKRSKMFKVVVVGNKHYKWGKDSEVPLFGDFDESERFTLPFLAGILKRYEAIPAVQKIIDKLPKIFNISEAEMKSKSAIFHTGPEFYDENNPSFEENIIKSVIKIISFIHQKQVVEFNYTSTSDYEDVKNKLYHKIVAPLQIRYYEHYFYLIGYDFDYSKLSIFRIDQIYRQKIDIKLDENEQSELFFDYEDLEKKTKIHNRYKDSLGIWFDSEEDKAHEIKVVFRNFAATYMKRLKFQKNQTIVSENKKDGTITMSFKLNLRPKSKIKNIQTDLTKEIEEGYFNLVDKIVEQRLKKDVTDDEKKQIKANLKKRFKSQLVEEIEERHYELAFLLGRFRQYAEIISYKQI